jgi:hypothetical protein
MIVKWCSHAHLYFLLHSIVCTFDHFTSLHFYLKFSSLTIIAMMVWIIDLQHTIPACMMLFELVAVRFIKNHPLWELATVMMIPITYVTMTAILWTYFDTPLPYPFMKQYQWRDLLSMGVCATAAASVLHWILNNGRRATGHYTLS